MISILIIFIISIMQSVNPSPTNTWKIAVLAFFAIIFLLSGILLLYFLARPNQVWIQHSNYILNDARIMIRKEELFGSQFDQWLSQQEINSQPLLPYAWSPGLKSAKTSYLPLRRKRVLSPKL